MRLVPLLRVGQRQQDLSFLAGPALRELAVAGRLRALVGQILPPASDLTGRTARGSGHIHIMAIAPLSDTSVVASRPPHRLVRIQQRHSGAGF